MRYFTIEECTRSVTAVAEGIYNTPSSEIKAHIVESVETLLDPLCEAWGRHCNSKGLGLPGIRISSGYRCRALNELVSGSSNSAHLYGYAFDLIPVNGRMMEFKHFCHEFLASRKFDQLISEVENKNGLPKWMHVGYKYPDGIQLRGQFLSMINGKYYPKTK